MLAHGDLDAAGKVFGDALARSEQLTGNQPNEVSWHSLAAVSHERLGAVHRRRNDPAGAAVAYRRALTSSQEILRLAPSSDDARKNLAMIQQLITEAEAEVAGKAHR